PRTWGRQPPHSLRPPAPAPVFLKQRRRCSAPARAATTNSAYRRNSREVHMVSFDRDELEQAFRRYWQTGAVGERWDAWADLFTEDADYVEHVLGNLKGREAIRAWIKPIMAQYGELYTAYEWHTVDAESGRVIVYMQNRRDHPSGKGVIDFPGITVLGYAGTGKWKREEDFWALPKATKASEE